MSETCARCEHSGADRRTLWMACFYDMSELAVPFERTPFGEREFYTLRVCKRCRGDWMLAIQAWFEDKPEIADADADDPPPEEPSHGIYVRKLGVTRLATDEEVAELRARGKEKP